MNVLIVDDEPDIIELLRYNLVREGFTVDSALTGDRALKKVNSENYDLIILDLMLPVIPGLELCRIMRRDKRTCSIPIIMLTAKTDETDKIVGLEMGADDYITKPFSPRELIARVKAVLRRTREGNRAASEIRSGDLYINLEEYRVEVNGRPVKLSATEFKMLSFLAQRKGRVFNREQLLDAVWEGETFVTPRTVDVHIKRIRNQIENDPRSPRYIKTMRGIGYYFSSEPLCNDESNLTDDLPSIRGE
jgi:phosphate regulon transcriptional regulator PhoB